MKFKITQTIEIDETQLAYDLGESLGEAISHQDKDLAYNLEFADYELERATILARIGEIWIEQLNELLTNK